MIYITGDTHGFIERFRNNALGDAEWTKDDYLIVCGDFSFIYNNDETEKLELDELEKKPYTILFVDGNHENFTVLNSLPVENWHGGKIHRIRKNIIHLMRCQIFEIEGKRFLTIGGAYSIDRSLRKKNVSYWDEELLSDSEYEEAVELIKQKREFDYVITHTAPSAVIKAMGYYVDAHDMRTTSLFDTISQNCNFIHWYFGHFHEDIRSILVENVSGGFTALLDDVVTPDEDVPFRFNAF